MSESLKRDDEMSTRAIEPKTLNQPLNETGAESILNRIDTMIGEMTQLRLHTMIGEMVQLRQLIQGLLPAKSVTVNHVKAITADSQDWVEELYGSLAPPETRSLEDELDFYYSIDVGLQRFDEVGI